MPPAELLAHLSPDPGCSRWMACARDGPSKTLRGAIGWSYDLLAPEHTEPLRTSGRVCRWLHAGSSRNGVRRRARAGHVLDGIALLLDKSLLQRETGQHGEARYVMLETVREYAMERLEVSGESESTHALSGLLCALLRGRPGAVWPGNG